MTRKESDALWHKAMHDAPRPNKCTRPCVSVHFRAFALFIPLTALALAATGCGSEINRAADYKVVCSLAGEAFFVRPNVGDTSIITRQPDADFVCAGFAVHPRTG